MIVYRVENEKRQGPYNPVKHCDDNPTPNRPGPVRDELIALADLGYIFGFPSIEAAQSWFYWDDRKKLAARGFVLAKYDAREAWKLGKSGKQVVFCRSDAVLLGEVGW